MNRSVENRSRLSDPIRSLFAFGASFLPVGKAQFILFAAVFAFYFFLSILVFTSSEVIEKFAPGYWGYLGYDNAWYINVYFSVDTTEGLFLSRHPFLKLFFVPMSILGQVLVGIGGLRLKTLFYIVVFNSVTALSVLGVFRWLRDILALSLFRSLLLTVMFATFFSNLVLSFTPESFPVSQLILIGSILVAVRMSQDKKTVPFMDYFVWTLSGGAVTVTNAVCTSLIFSLTPGRWSRAARYVVAAALIMIVLYVIYFALFGGIFLFLPEGTSLTEWLYANYIAYNRNVPTERESFFSAQYFDLCVNRFWSNSLVGPVLHAGTDPTLSHLAGISYSVPQVAERTTVTRTVCGMILLGLFILGALASVRDRRILFPLAVFGFSAFLHLILRFGWQEPHIYADHWIFTVPMIVAGLYIFTDNHKCWNYAIDFMLTALLMVLIYTNGIAFYEFVKISEHSLF